MKIRFWGVRGSIPTPGKTTVKYGGNTTCIEIRGDNDELLIIDAGTGIKPLGDFIMKYDADPYRNLDLSILLSHTHWDHIQGFPFFAPAYEESTNIKFFGPVNFSDKLEEILIGDAIKKYFPIKLDEMKAKLSFRELQESTFSIGNFNISTTYMNHPILDLGYRIEYNGKIVVTMYDTEPYRNTFANQYDEMDDFDKMVFAEAEDEVNKRLTKHKQHAKGADLLIYDAQYKENEYQTKLGWGHSYIEYAVDMAIEAGAKILTLFHHDPLRADNQVDDIQQEATRYAREKGSNLIVFCARERLEVTI